MTTKDVNNPEAPQETPVDAESAVEDAFKDTGQVEGQGEKTDSQKTEQPDEGSEAGDSEVKLPDDPKELRKAFTQKTQEFAQKEKSWAKEVEELKQWRTLSQDPDFRTFAKSKMEAEKGTEKEDTGLTLDAMDDKQKEFYKVVQPYIQMALKPQSERIASLENQNKVLNQEKLMAQTGAWLEANPDAKGRESELAGIIEAHKVSLPIAWKILTSDSAEAKAKQKVAKELDLKKEGNLLKPGDKRTAQPVERKGKMTPGQAVEDAISTVGGL